MSLDWRRVQDYASSLLDSLRVSIKASGLLKNSSLVLILLTGIVIRLLPLRYGAHIGEFDPYLQWGSARFIVDSIEQHGILGFFDFFAWHNDRIWAPGGVQMGETFFPGVPYAGALTYFFVTALGFDVQLETVVAYFPVLTGTLSIFLIYLIGRRVKDETVGLTAALFLSISPAFINRSLFGWYDTETLGILALLAALYFYLTAIDDTQTRGRRYTATVLAGLSTGVMAASWGAFLFLMAIMALFTILVSVIGEMPEEFEYTTAIYFTIALVMTMSVPRNGLEFAFHPVAIASYVAVLTPVLASRMNLNLRKVGILSVTGLVLFLLLLAPHVLALLPQQIGGRILAVVNPFFRAESALVASVQEQQGAGITSFFSNFSFMIPFAVYGLYVNVRDRRAEDVLLLLLGVTTIYFAGSFARLGTLAAPFVALVGAYGLGEVLTKIYRAMTEEDDDGRARTYGVFIFLLFIMVVALFSFVPAINAGDTPPTVTSSSLPLNVKDDDWLQTLSWMRQNLPEEEIVCSWWDYGYWISFLGGSRSVADNATINATRIRQLADMFLSDEETAINIMKDLNCDYVLVYMTASQLPQQRQQQPQQPRQDFYTVGIFTGRNIVPAGEEGKFVQMALIRGMSQQEISERFINRTTFHLRQGFWNTFLGKLMPYEFVQTQSQQGVSLDIYRQQFKYPRVPDGESPLVLTFASEGPVSQRQWAHVLVYELVDDQ